MNILSSNDCIKSKIEGFKKNSNLESDEYDSSTIRSNFSERLKTAMDKLSDNFSYDPYMSDYYDYDKLSEDLRDQLYDDFFGPYGDMSKVDPYIEDLYYMVNDNPYGDPDEVYDILCDLSLTRSELFKDPNSSYVKAYNTLSNEENEYDYDPYRDQFTDEEKKMVTLACYIISNVNHAMRYLDRGIDGYECEPTLDKAYRVLDDPTRSEITNELFNFNINPDSYKPMPEYEMLRNVMRKIRVNYGRYSRYNPYF